MARNPHTAQMAHDDPHAEKTTRALLARLSRAEGQVRALRVAIEDGTVEDCKAFISQVKAARAALKRASEQYVLAHISACQDLPIQERDAQVAEAIRTLASD